MPITKTKTYQYQAQCDNCKTTKNGIGYQLHGFKKYIQNLQWTITKNAVLCPDCSEHRPQELSYRDYRFYS